MALVSLGEPETHYRTCGDLLRAMRVRAGLTQYDLAARLGVHQPWVSKVEQGKRRLDVVELVTYCGACGASASEFTERLSELFAHSCGSEEDGERSS